MRQIELIILTILIFATSNVFAHKDRIERPTRIQFVFDNQDTVNLTDKDDSEIKSYSQEIVDGKRKLTMAQLTFDTGETATFEYENSRLSRIKIASDKKNTTVPKETIEKIKEIHFQTIVLLWDGRDKKAFSASYYYIQFDIGTVKSYNDYPYVQLFFKKQIFSKAIIWTPISERSKQCTDL